MFSSNWQFTCLFWGNAKNICMFYHFWGTPQYKDVNIGIPIIKIRLSHDRVIFITEIPIPGKTVSILRRGPGRWVAQVGEIISQRRHLSSRAADITYWGRVTYICVGKLTIIGSDNDLSPGRRQAIIWTNARKLLIRCLENKLQWNFNRNSYIFI